MLSCPGTSLPIDVLPYERHVRLLKLVEHDCDLELLPLHLSHRLCGVLALRDSVRRVEQLFGFEPVETGLQRSVKVGSGLVGSAHEASDVLRDGSDLRTHSVSSSVKGRLCDVFMEVSLCLSASSGPRFLGSLKNAGGASSNTCTMWFISISTASALSVSYVRSDTVPSIEFFLSSS